MFETLEHLLLYCIFFDFSLTEKAAPYEWVIRTGQPKT